jgi:hypothetical protein
MRNLSAWKVIGYLQHQAFDECHWNKLTGWLDIPQRADAADPEAIE